MTLVDAFRDEGAEVVSSSRIRELLAEGDVAEAAGLLGYRFTVEAEVIARQAAWPHAGLSDRQHGAAGGQRRCRHGIYAVRFRRADGTLHDGVASFGRRPTVDDDGAPLLETFVFDFSGDLYGEICRGFASSASCAARRNSTGSTRWSRR